MKPTPNLPTVEAPAMEPWRQLLWRAAQLIEERGHAKHALEDSRGRLCAIGALDMASIGNTDSCANGPDDMRAWGALRDRVGHVTIWNNAPERTADEVIATMRACALEG